MHHDLRFINNFIYVIGGFTQKTGSDTGMMRLWARLFKWRAFDSRHALTFILPREWDDSTKEMAAMMDRHAAMNQRTRIIIAGYSWGAGHGAIQLAKAFKTVGRDIDLLLLIDPVYRSKLPLVFRLLAFTRWFGITIPDNVRHVMAWRQDNDGPRGTKIKLANASRTTILAELDLSSRGLTHHTIQYDHDVLTTCFNSTIKTLETTN